jgi:geranyl-CoA carboxylase alpha subunit
VGEQQVSLTLLASDGRWATVERDGIRQRLAYHLDGEHIWLYVHAGNLHFTDITHQPVSSAAVAGSGSVKAPMDGAIVEVLVEEGATVSKGQLLVVLEAMKMEHPLKASIDGVVRRIGVSRGDQVKNRQLLVEIEASEA